MTKILCAVRGGPDSEQTIKYAVSLAKEQDARLIFLYVVSLELFVSSSSIRSESIAKELSRMGEFILLMAQAKAATQGVAADTFVRRGNIPEQILAACGETRAEMLIMGKPREGNKENFFDNAKQEDFAKKMEEKYGVKVILGGC